jgi:hypothetical protein
MIESSDFKNEHDIPLIEEVPREVVVGWDRPPHPVR